jgi:hypothetical protein
MLRKLIKISSVFLLVSISLSFTVVLKGENPHRNRTKESEITFFGPEETRWTEKREIPLPLMIGQGVKEEPQWDSLSPGEGAIGPIKKMSTKKLFKPFRS